MMDAVVGSLVPNYYCNLVQCRVGDLLSWPLWNNPLKWSVLADGVMNVLLIAVQMLVAFGVDSVCRCLFDWHDCLVDGWENWRPIRVWHLASLLLYQPALGVAGNVNEYARSAPVLSA